MKEVPDYIKEILIKHFHGAESADEEAQLNAWRRERPEQEDEYQELMKLWTESGSLSESKEFDTAKAWNKLDLRLQNKISDDGVIRTIARGKRVSIIKIAIAASVVGIMIFIGRRLIVGKDQDKLLQLSEAVSENKQIILPDGSTVTLRKGGTLKYPPVFADKERAVMLTGDAFFQVKPEQNHPFRIQTEKSLIEVKGTSFLVRSGTESDRVIVASGKVMFASKQDLSLNCLLQAKQEARFDGKKFEQKNVTDSNYLAWHTHQLKYDDVPLGRVVAELSDYYETSVLLQDQKSMKDILVTGSFNNQSIEQVLDEITLFTGLKYRKEKDGFVLFTP